MQLYAICTIETRKLATMHWDHYVSSLFQQLLHNMDPDKSSFTRHQYSFTCVKHCAHLSGLRNCFLNQLAYGFHIEADFSANVLQRSVPHAKCVRKPMVGRSQPGHFINCFLQSEGIMHNKNLRISEFRDELPVDGFDRMEVNNVNVEIVTSVYHIWKYGSSRHHGYFGASILKDNTFPKFDWHID